MSWSLASLQAGFLYCSKNPPVELSEVGLYWPLSFLVRPPSLVPRSASRSQWMVVYLEMRVSLDEESWSTSVAGEEQHPDHRGNESQGKQSYYRLLEDRKSSRVYGFHSCLMDQNRRDRTFVEL